MSFKDLVKQRILQTIKDVKSDWKVMILDSTCMRTISSACGMFDIMAQGVTLVDDLFKVREPMPSMDVIYFMTPTQDSIERFAEDEENQYKNVYLLFSSTLSDEMVKLIKNSKASQLKKIKMIKEINFEFYAYEERIFHLDESDSFLTIYGKKFDRMKDLVAQEIAKKLSGIFFNLGENPIVRYQKSSPLCLSVAERFSRILDNYASSSNSFPEKSTRPTFLILDRSFDLVSPFMHELTYQAMLKEFLPIKNDIYTYEVDGEDKKEEKTAILNEGDPLWPQLRHLYIGDAIQYVIDNFKSFSNEAKNFNPSEFKNISEMQTALKNLPRITELKSKYSLHLNLSKVVSKKFTDNMKTIISKEQDLATKEDFKNKKIKKSQRISIVKEILGNKSLDEDSRLRILLIFIAREGGIENNVLSDFQEIAGFGPKSKVAIQTIISLVKNSPKIEPKKSNKKEISKTAEYFRFKPFLSVILEDLSSGNLSRDDFAFLKSGESGTSKDKKEPENKNVSLISASIKNTGGGSGGSWKNRNKNDSKDSPNNNNKDSNNSLPNLSSDKRIIVFIIGGASYSELRTVYELSSSTQTDIILGSTFLYSGNNFHHQVTNID